MVQAYGVLANGGIKVQPTAILKIVDRNGQVVEEHSIQEKRVVDEKRCSNHYKYARIRYKMAVLVVMPQSVVLQQVKLVQQMIPRMLGSLVTRLI